MNSKIRLSFQIVILLLVIWTIYSAGDIEKYCPMGGMLGFGSKIYQQSLPCSMSSVAIFMALALLVGALAIGKLFCGFLCPVGSITEWFGKIGSKFKLQFRLPKIGDRLLRAGKYIFLYLVVYNTIIASELFCRKFDPFFGVARGLGSDTVLLWSLGAIVVTFIGSIFVKQLWCRYFCFLGAASNIFVNIWGALLVFAAYFVLNLLGLNLSVLWLIAGLALAGYLMEVGLFRTVPFPAFKITVNESKCTQCGLCCRACPYDIKVQSFQKVTHPDCVICTECISACREEKAIDVNGSPQLKYLPALVVLALISLGFALSSKYEFSTLEKRWGKFENLEHAAIYHQTGLKSIKCWGSSMSLYNFMKNRHGIYGLDVYASSHAVAIYFDSTEITREQVKQTLFNPERFRTRIFNEYTPAQLSGWEVGIEKLFDSVDQSNLNAALFQNRFVFGIETYFGEPVIAKIYFDADSTTTNQIKKVIEARNFATEIDGKKTATDINFRCAGAGELLGVISLENFNRLMFESYELEFKDYQTANPEKIQIYEIGMPDAVDPLKMNNMDYLVSALSNETGLLRVRTLLKDRPVLQILFDKEKLNGEKIEAVLFEDTLKYFIDENTLGTVENGFRFEGVGKTDRLGKNQ